MTSSHTMVPTTYDDDSVAGAKNRVINIYHYFVNECSGGDGRGHLYASFHSLDMQEVASYEYIGMLQPNGELTYSYAMRNWTCCDANGKIDFINIHGKGYVGNDINDIWDDLCEEFTVIDTPDSASYDWIANSINKEENGVMEFIDD